MSMMVSKANRMMLLAITLAVSPIHNTSTYGQSLDNNTSTERVIPLLQEVEPFELARINKLSMPKAREEGKTITSSCDNILCAYRAEGEVTFLSILMFRGPTQPDDGEQFLGAVAEDLYEKLGRSIVREELFGRDALFSFAEIEREGQNAAVAEVHFLAQGTWIWVKVLRTDGAALEEIKGELVNFLLSVVVHVKSLDEGLEMVVSVRNTASLEAGIGSARVTILGAEFEPEDVQALSFGPSNAEPSNKDRPVQLDIDGNGVPDITYLFPISETGLTAADTEGCLTIELPDRTLSGCAPITYQ